jgi:hypothetical protein
MVVDETTVLVETAFEVTVFVTGGLVDEATRIAADTTTAAMTIATATRERSLADRGFTLAQPFGSRAIF